MLANIKEFSFIFFDGSRDLGWRGERVWLLATQSPLPGSAPGHL